jgi:pimeloyl-ACP methyl ester carboxylesterase
MSDVITSRELAEIDAANTSGLRPVVFIHGLWLHWTSWNRWAEVFREAGYAPLQPGWPGDPDTVLESREHPEAFAGVGVEQTTQHFATILRALHIPPLLVGHSVGGLIAQKLLGQNLGAGAVAIDAVPFRGVLRLPLSALRAAFPVLRSPRNRKRAVSLTPEQFRYAYANAVSAVEAAELYEVFAIPGAGRPIFQVATANLSRHSETRVKTDNPQRGPLLLISGVRDHSVPMSLVKAEYRKHQRRSEAVTELEQIDNRGHSLTIDSGWPEVAQRALGFGKRYVN